MRKLFRIGGFSLGGILALLLSYIGLLFYSSVLFANHVEYGAFTVHSDQQFGRELESALSDIDAALMTSEIYDPALKHDIFFGYGNKPFNALHSIWGLTYNLSWPPHASQVITLRVPNFEANGLSHPERQGSVNLRQMLTHEVVHTLLRSKLGLLGVARSPMWKQEGYADYVAASTTTLADPAYDMRASVERILRQDLSWMTDDQGNFTRMRYGCSGKASVRNEEGFWSPTCYYISRVLWEYLLNVKGLTFDEAMSPEITDTSTLIELIAAYKAGKLS